MMKREEEIIFNYDYEDVNERMEEFKHLKKIGKDEIEKILKRYKVTPEELAEHEKETFTYTTYTLMRNYIRGGWLDMMVKMLCGILALTWLITGSDKSFLMLLVMISTLVLGLAVLTRLTTRALELASLGALNMVLGIEREYGFELDSEALKRELAQILVGYDFRIEYDNLRPKF